MYTNILKQCPHTLDNQQNKLLTGSVGAASSDNSSSSKKKCSQHAQWIIQRTATLFRKGSESQNLDD